MCAFVPELREFTKFTRDEFQRGQIFPRQNAMECHAILFLMELPREANYLINFKTVFFCKIVLKIKLLSKIPKKLHWHSRGIVAASIHRLLKYNCVIP